MDAGAAASGLQEPAAARGRRGDRAGRRDREPRRPRRVVRRPTPAGALLAWTFVGSLLVYSWASERFAWLTLHSAGGARPAGRHRRQRGRGRAGTGPAGGRHRARGRGRRLPRGVILGRERRALAARRAADDRGGAARPRRAAGARRADAALDRPLRVEVDERRPLVPVGAVPARPAGRVSRHARAATGRRPTRSSSARPRARRSPGSSPATAAAASGARSPRRPRGSTFGATCRPENEGPTRALPPGGATGARGVGRDSRGKGRWHRSTAPTLRGLRSRQVSGARSAVPCSPSRLGHRNVGDRAGWGRGLQTRRRGTCGAFSTPHINPG